MRLTRASSLTKTSANPVWRGGTGVGGVAARRDAAYVSERIMKLLSQERRPETVQTTIMLRIQDPGRMQPRRGQVRLEPGYWNDLASSKVEGARGGRGIRGSTCVRS